MKLAFWLLAGVPVFAQSLCPVSKAGTAGIQEAIDACAAKGGGMAYVPPGEYVVGALWLKSNVELRLEAGATIALSQNPADWPTDAPALINALGARNIAITGRGTIDGRAQYEYAGVRRQDVEIAAEQEIARRSGVELKRYYRTGVEKYDVVLRDSQQIRIDGVRIVNSPLWTLRLQDCDQVWIRGVYIFSDLEKGVNADGIDIVSSSNIAISDSTIITGDDAICLKAQAWGSWGPDPAGSKPRPVRPTENVTVSNCILSSSSTPMMIGTETYADIRHVLFSTIVVRDSNKVFGINVQDGGTVSEVRFLNVTFELNRRHWNWWGSAELMKFVLKRRSPESPLGRIEHITVDGAQGTARGTSLVAGQADRMLEDISISNVHLRMLAENKPDKRAIHALVFERVKGLKLRDIGVEWDPDRPEPLWGSALVLRDVDGLDLREFKGIASHEGVEAVVKERVR